MVYIWVLIIVLLTFVEIMTVNLTTIWFVVSGLLSLVSSFLTDNFLIQFGIFVVVGIILLVTTRPIMTKFLKKKDVATNTDRIIGMEGIVTENISKKENGEVKVDGKKWTAYADKAIKKDTVVEVLEINGVKIKVKEVCD